MICDTLTNASRYQHLHPKFPMAFAWVAQAENRARTDGEYEVVGRDLYVIIQTGQTMPAHEKRFESHRRYIDIQINLSGCEIMEWTPSTGLPVIDDFKPDNDIRFHAPVPHATTSLLIKPNEFAIFWPEDAHKPCCNPFGSAM